MPLSFGTNSRGEFESPSCFNFQKTLSGRINPQQKLNSDISAWTINTREVLVRLHFFTALNFARPCILVHRFAGFEVSLSHPLPAIR